LTQINGSDAADPSRATPWTIHPVYRRLFPGTMTVMEPFWPSPSSAFAGSAASSGCSSQAIWRSWEEKLEKWGEMNALVSV
jgi:hypothetical protein